MHEKWQYNEPTVQDKEIVEEMNTINMEHNPETNDEEGNLHMTEKELGNTTAYGNNLWPIPTKQQEAKSNANRATINIRRVHATALIHLDDTDTCLERPNIKITRAPYYW